MQTELDEQIRTRLDEARETLFEHQSPASIVFYVSGHPTRVLVAEALRGRSGFLTLAGLGIES